MKNNAFLTRLWDTDLERFMRFYNMEMVEVSCVIFRQLLGDNSQVLVSAMIYDFNEILTVAYIL